MKHISELPQYLEQRIERITESGCWIWMAKGLLRGGYGPANFNWKSYQAHRLSWMAYRGEIPDGLHVCHHCDVRLCINPYHLFLGTHDDNMADKVAKNRQARGVANGMAILTPEIASAIRAANGTQTAIATEYGICQQTVSAIRLGKLWREP